MSVWAQETEEMQNKTTANPNSPNRTGSVHVPRGQQSIPDTNQMTPIYEKKNEQFLDEREREEN